LQNGIEVIGPQYGVASRTDSTLSSIWPRCLCALRSVCSTTNIDAKAIGVAAWLTIASLLFPNALFHSIGTIRTKMYSPGAATAVALYVTMAAFGYWHFVRDGRLLS